MPFKNGTTIYEILISCNASQVEDYSDVTFDRAFDPEGPGRGSPVRDGLSKMRESVNEAIDLLIPRIP
jgi:hypothetical protein